MGMHNHSDIPEQFYNSDSKQPFERCVSCDDKLNDKTYFVEKAFKKDPLGEGHQVIFEYAICFACAEKKNSELSVDSKANIQRYFEEKSAEREEPVWLGDDRNMEQCMLSEIPLNECDEYVIYGQFEGDQMVRGMFPYGMSGAVLDEITDLLSEQTLGEIDDFIGEHFTGPPEFRELLKDKKWVVL